MVANPVQADDILGRRFQPADSGGDVVHLVFAGNRGDVIFPRIFLGTGPMPSIFGNTAPT